MVPLDALDQCPPTSKQTPIRNLPVRKIDFSLPSPICPKTLGSYLEGYDQCDKLIKGFSQGFPLGCVGKPPPRTVHNHPSVAVHMDFVSNKIVSEIGLKRIRGPYNVAPLHDFVCSPLGVVPKKVKDSYRLIHDLSFSRGAPSVNSLIPKENF